VKPTWQTENGDVRLYFGDAREVLPTLEVESDALLTDPPYGIVNQFGENEGNGTRTMQFEWDSPDITLQVLEALPVAFSRCKSKSGAFVFCGGDQFGQILEVVRAAGYVAKPAAWFKECPPPAGAGNWWPSAFEFAVYGYKNSPYFGDTDPKRNNAFWSDSYRYGQPGKVNHPTQKPLRLIKRLVNAIVPPRGVALDCYLGSGTTAVACIETGRRCIGIERNPEYFAICEDRCRNAERRVRQVGIDASPAIQRSLLEERS
jgi:site-specific DNA-methyltransferase (adenine-specific)